MSIDYTNFKYPKKTIKKNKIANLERKRFSILTKNMEKCFICGRKKDDLHEVFRGRNRRKSMEYGLVVPLCRTCHTIVDNNRKESLKLEEKAKDIFIKKYSLEKFIEEFK
jgi:5-methylcytosine-specific restriction endonuclease McrA